MRAPESWCTHLACIHLLSLPDSEISLLGFWVLAMETCQSFSAILLCTGFLTYTLMYIGFLHLNVHGSSAVPLCTEFHSYTFMYRVSQLKIYVQDCQRNTGFGLMIQTWWCMCKTSTCRLPSLMKYRDSLWVPDVNQEWG